jgi:NADPH-dependent curcumin reductase CurA
MTISPLQLAIFQFQYWWNPPHYVCNTSYIRGFGARCELPLVTGAALGPHAKTSSMENAMPVNRQFLLVRRPDGDPVPEDFSLIGSAIPTPQAGGLVVRNHFASLDPAQRGWMDDLPSYMPPIPLGAPVMATTVGRVYASDSADFAVGDWVLGLNALEDYSCVAPGGFTSKIDVSLLPSPTMFLSGMGAVGLTAYFGTIDGLKPVPGETLLVSGAAGAVGSVVGQIGKVKGCRVIGIAGGAEKCRRLTEDYGFDVAIDYRGKSVDMLSAEIAKAAPEGVNMVFENVGGDVLDAELMNLAMNARILLCGLISEYNSDAGKVGARNLWQLIVKRASMRGFLIADYVPRFAEGGMQIAQWIGEGKMRIDEDVQEGLENAYDAFMRLFSGANTGKLILKIA